MESKAWYKSNTIRGVLIMALSFLAQKFGVGIGAESMADTIYAVVDTVGAVIAAIGARNALADGSKPVGK